MGVQGAERHHLVTDAAGEVLLWDFLQSCQPVLRAEGAALLVIKGVHERQYSCVFTCFVTLMYTFCRGASLLRRSFCRGASLLRRSFHGALTVLACSMVSPAADSKLPARCVWV